jgi:hypothetical protein
VNYELFVEEIELKEVNELIVRLCRVGWLKAFYNPAQWQRIVITCETTEQQINVLCTATI